MALSYNGRHVIDSLFTLCTEQVRSPYTEHAASGLPKSTLLEGEVWFVQAQDQHQNSNWVFTHSTDVD